VALWDLYLGLNRTPSSRNIHGSFLKLVSCTRCFWHQRRTGLHGGRRFDAAVWSFGPPDAGASLHLLSDEPLFVPHSLREWLVGTKKKNPISFIPTPLASNDRSGWRRRRAPRNADRRDTLHEYFPKLHFDCEQLRAAECTVSLLGTVEGTARILPASGTYDNTEYTSWMEILSGGGRHPWRAVIGRRGLAVGCKSRLNEEQFLPNPFRSDPELACTGAATLESTRDARSLCGDKTIRSRWRAPSGDK